MAMRLCGGLLAALAGAATFAWQAPAALGADSLYWTNHGSGAIRLGDLGSGMVHSLITGESTLSGLALDPAAGRIYWSDDGGASLDGAIRSGSLDGGGAAQDLFTGEPAGPLTIDPTAGKAYWIDGDPGNSAIRVGGLTGGAAQSLFTGLNSPTGLAVDPKRGKLYWADKDGVIRVGPLSGGSAQELFTGESAPAGVAIDEAANKLYWADALTGVIRTADLAAGTAPRDLFTGENDPVSVAIDPAAGKIYWTDAASGVIRAGNLSGGTAHDLFAGEAFPLSLALLQAPPGAGAPVISGGSVAGSRLMCSPGTWGGDLVGSHLYRAPASFAYQWSRNGSDISGASSSSYTASAAGSYTCRVTATNQAGSTSQTSAPLVVPSLALTGVRESHRRWREGSRRAVISSARTPVGTTFLFALNESARVTFAFIQRVAGRMVGARCVTPSAANRHRPACKRTVTRGSLAFNGHAGQNKVKFQGRLSRAKRLRPGRYTLVITVTDAAGMRATGSLTFTIGRS